MWPSFVGRRSLVTLIRVPSLHAIGDWSSPMSCSIACRRAALPQPPARRGVRSQLDRGDACRAPLTVYVALPLNSQWDCPCCVGCRTGCLRQDHWPSRPLDTAAIIVHPPGLRTSTKILVTMGTTVWPIENNRCQFVSAERTVSILPTCFDL